ncbi:hypothetical protein RRF57_004897 [Xylaria bambusicola]|uniref:Uncharacterized protein n=1 Tax=Xylaria bambusicola TaxID=326684 RepID=A0AAN7Z4Q9_9PEZI
MSANPENQEASGQHAVAAAAATTTTDAAAATAATDAGAASDATTLAANAVATSRRDGVTSFTASRHGYLCYCGPIEGAGQAIQDAKKAGYLQPGQQLQMQIHSAQDSNNQENGPQGQDGAGNH